MQVYKINTCADYGEFYAKEKDLYQLWIYICKHRMYLKEYKLKGIDSGILNESEGPDFQGAEFELDGKIFRGDVEIHKQCSDWNRHGHHLDQRYDRVVLHLVWGKSIHVVFNSKNQNIPSISMLNFPNPIKSDDCTKNCIFNTSQPYFPESLLQDLALQRLTNKANGIYKLVASEGIDQTLYLVLLKSLGNVVNKNTYERLAQLIPWKLIHLLKENNKTPEFWTALFCGTAGFITEKSDTDIKMHWKNCLPLIEGTILKREIWKFGGIRPYNNPQNRLAGLAMFIWQMEDPSIYNILEQLFYERLSTSEFISKLISKFGGIQMQNLNGNNLNQSTLWGRNLIIEFAGNVFIPLFYKIAILNNSFGFAMYLKQLFLELPATQYYGVLNPFKKWLKTNSKETKHFYINQALLHLKNTYCSFNNFQECPLKTIKQKN
ncbi:MAG: DUF2851 family protein [Calditrichia bacterium]|nr:DUF2851 family protein [Calditrichia bacterium]